MSHPAPPVTWFFFDRDALLARADRYRDEFVRAEPFSHVVLDDFLPEDALDALLREFPEPGEAGWRRRDVAHERKLGLSDETAMGPNTRHVLQQLNSQVFLEFLERITGIDGLIPDPHFVGGGLHQIVPGGLLKIHADFNRHQRLALDRRLNLLLYLNRDWNDTYGGHLELWDRSMTVCRQRILPIFNRCVIFATSEESYHGHPDPLTCPPGRARRSMALYYYTAPGENADAPFHTTLFRPRPSDAPVQRPGRARRAARRVLPPVVLDVARAIRRRPGSS